MQRLVQLAAPRAARCAAPPGRGPADRRSQPSKPHGEGAGEILGGGHATDCLVPRLVPVRRADRRAQHRDQRAVGKVVRDVEEVILVRHLASVQARPPRAARSRQRLHRAPGPRWPAGSAAQAPARPSGPHVLRPRGVTQHRDLEIGQRPERPREPLPRGHRTRRPPGRGRAGAPLRRAASSSVLRTSSSCGVQHAPAPALVGDVDPARPDHRHDDVGIREPFLDVAAPRVPSWRSSRVEEDVVLAEAPLQRVGELAGRRRRVRAPVAHEQPQRSASASGGWTDHRGVAGYRQAHPSCMRGAGSA